MDTQDTIPEPARDLPVIDEVDLLVLGGSCTGLFAAIRAARLGLKVAVVDRANCFGGAAATANVHIWHQLQDLAFERQIIGGLTVELVQELARHGHATHKEARLNAWELNTEELKLALDRAALAAGVRPHLHTFFSAPICEDGVPVAAAVETVAGRAAIRARCFVDATGDGWFCHRLGLAGYRLPHPQPPTTIAKLAGLRSLGAYNWRQALQEHGSEFGLADDWGWNARLPGAPDVSVWSETHIKGLDPTNPAQLTATEIEGRRQVAAQLALLRHYGPPGTHLTLIDLPAMVGIQDGRHVRARHRVTEADILSGRHFDDAVANGTYRVDVHHADRLGLTFKYLDGVQEEIFSRADTPVVSRWRPVTKENPLFYQVPYGALLPADGPPNLLMAGRMIDADAGGFGAVRVMVNLNQLGEAAGVAAALHLATGTPVAGLDPAAVRRALADGGSIVV